MRRPAPPPIRRLARLIVALLVVAAGGAPTLAVADRSDAATSPGPPDRSASEVHVPPEDPGEGIYIKLPFSVCGEAPCEEIPECGETCSVTNPCDDEEVDCNPCDDASCDICDHVPCDLCDDGGCNPCRYVDCEVPDCERLDCPGPYKIAVSGVPCLDEPCPQPEPIDVPCITEPCPFPGQCLTQPILICTGPSICYYADGLQGFVGQGVADCVERACTLEEGLERDLVYTGDSDSDGIEDCHDPDVDGDGLSNVLEEAIGYNPADSRSDGDGVPDAFDLMPGTDSKVKVWFRIDTIEQPDWEDDGTGPDPYLRSRVGMSVDGTTPKEANKLSFDGLRLGDHIHDKVDEKHRFEDPRKDYQEVAVNFPQRWHPTRYPSLEGGGKLELEWELPLWEHDDNHFVGPDCDDLDCDAEDDKASSLDPSDVALQLLKIAQRGHVPGTISAETETISGPPGEEVNTTYTWLDFGPDVSLRIEIGANLPNCPILLGRHAWDLKGMENDEELGNAYVGIGEPPEHGSTLDGTERGLCGLSGDDGNLVS